MVPSRRRQSIDYLSPAISSNRKRLDHLPNNYSTRWSLTSTLPSEDDHDHYDDDDESIINVGSPAGRSSDRMLMMMAGGMRLRRGSSFGSCGPCSIGSFADRCPTTPSPICSPASPRSCSPDHPSEPRRGVSTADDPSFATPNQSSCVISNDGDKTSAGSPGEEIKQESRIKANQSGHSRMKNTRPEGQGSTNSKHIARSTVGRSVEQHFSCEARNSVGGDGDDEDGRLPTVSEEQEDNGPHLMITTSSLLSSAGSGSEEGSSDRYENSEVESESTIEHQFEAARSTRPFRTRERRNHLADRLAAWKEARTVKIVNKLQKKEAAVDEWEKKKSTKAKMEMKEVEMKLEKRRTRGMEKMQRRIRRVQKEAEEKKAKEREAAAKKIAKLTKAFDHKMSVITKIPCCLLFL